MTPRVKRYVRDAANQHGVSEREILSRTRREPVATARADVMRRLRKDGFSLIKIGNWLDRDSSTVLYHVGNRA